MYVFGITGGVGSGKSEVLKYLKESYNVNIVLTDEVAKELMTPGHDCYNQIYSEFASFNVFDDNGSIIREKLAKLIFSDNNKRALLNSFVHPSVKKEVKNIVAKYKEENELDALFIESALLIEENYKEFCDDLWYIYTDKENRSLRLKSSRGYSDEKIENIIKSQLSEEIFRKECSIIIDNNNTIENTILSVDEVMIRYNIAKTKEKSND